MPNYLPPLNHVLDRINKHFSVATEDYDDTGEWFALESNHMGDRELYNFLESQWGGIVGAHANHFALIYCQSEPEAGVWLHFLSTAEDRREYAPGCHIIQSF
jgi:hypothetical protein